MDFTPYKVLDKINLILWYIDIVCFDCVVNHHLRAIFMCPFVFFPEGRAMTIRLCGWFPDSEIRTELLVWTGYPRHGWKDHGLDRGEDQQASRSGRRDHRCVVKVGVGEDVLPFVGPAPRLLRKKGVQRQSRIYLHMRTYPSSARNDYDYLPAIRSTKFQAASDFVDAGTAGCKW